MRAIKHILSKYTAYIWILLKPLGIWGVFVIGALDSAALGLPLDAIVAGYVYQDRSRFLLYALMASAGSAAGSIVMYLIGYSGGEALLRKRISPERFEKLHRSFEKHPFWGLMLPAMLPPPTPFKLFMLAAAISEMKFSHFLLAVFSGRFIRFLILGLLTLKFGPQIVGVVGSLFSRHVYWVLGVAIGLVIAWLWLRKKRAKNA